MAQEHIFLYDAAKDIQRAVRGHLARAAVRRMRLNAAAVRTQAWWRGCLGRAIADRIWLFNKVSAAAREGRTCRRCCSASTIVASANSQASLIQRHVRGWVARLHYKEYRDRLYDAATRIQAAARRWLAYQRRKQLLWTRETTERKEAIARMQVEMERLQEELGEMNRVRGEGLWLAAHGSHRALPPPHLAGPRCP